MLIGTGMDCHRIRIVDFGLANQYFDPTFNRHIPLTQRSTITGTLRYLSTHAHLGFEHARRDDLESLAYILIYFLRGSLPWQNVEARSRKRKYECILKMKLNTPVGTLCRGQPEVFKVFLNYVRGLAFDERPDYQHFRILFKNTLQHTDCHDNNTYDWCDMLPACGPSSGL